MILNSAKDIKLGVSQVDKIYVGNNLVWEHTTLQRGYTQAEQLQDDSYDDHQLSNDADE